MAGPLPATAPAQMVLSILSVGARTPRRSQWAVTIFVCLATFAIVWFAIRIRPYLRRDAMLYRRSLRLHRTGTGYHSLTPGLLHAFLILSSDILIPLAVLAIALTLTWSLLSAARYGAAW